MSLIDDVIKYYAARAPVYDETAGYMDPEAEQLRVSIKARYQKMFAGHAVLEIACATGYWTATVAASAKSVFAVDINPAVISQAKERCRNLSNVKFQIADAYILKDVPTGFSAAFGILWWSHVPKERIKAFFSALHGKLLPGALVMFVDQLPYDGHVRRQDCTGNTIEQRSLPCGSSFEVVKNFPTEENVRDTLSGMADNIQYIERPDEKSWDVIYNVKKQSPVGKT